MADVFLSYSQGAPEPTQNLAADLTKQRYAVWFDSRLLPGEAFWQVIEDKIVAAKAVIVIWTRPALTSRGVRAEAQLAYDKNKLICVRTPDVAASEVKLPFNALEQSLVTDRAKIYAALAQLGALPVEGAVPVLPKGERDSGEAAMAWDHIKVSRDAGDFEAFLEHYGEGHAFYARLARKQISMLKAGSSAVPVRPIAAVPAPAPAMPSAKDVFLRIEAGMHTAMINRISLTADGRTMATGSDDKTVRLWSLPDGALVRTLRPPIGPGNDGKVYAVELAPDGSWVASAGWDTSWTVQSQMFVTIFDPATGAVITRLGPLPGSVTEIEVSHDGRRLAAGLDNKNGIRVWDTNGWRQITEDRDYGGQVYGFSFASDGRLAATSYDGHMRLYDANGRLTQKAKLSGTQPSGVAFSPDGAQIAVVFNDAPRVDVLSGQTLAHVFSPDTSGMSNGGLNTVAWFASGTRLAAGGTYTSKGKCLILAWPNGGKGPRQEFPSPDNTVMDLAGWGLGLAFGASDPALGLLDGNGKSVLFRGPTMADMRRRPAEQFLISRDGTRMRFGIKDWTADPWVFDVAAESLAKSPTAPTDLLAPDTKRLPVEGWQDTSGVKLGSKALTLDAYERARSVAIAPDASSFVLGSDWSLRRFDKDGTQLWRKPVPGVAWGVNLAREGRLLLAAHGDGTIRWYSAADGEELLALFIHVSEDPNADKRWVLWTPEGYYTASPGGEDLIGWHVNRGHDQAADFYSADTFSSTFHKPDMVLKALDKADRPPGA